MRALRRLSSWVLAAAALQAAASPQSAGAPPGDGSFASGSHFEPAADEFLVSQTTSFIQYQPKLAVRPDGQGFVIAWSSAVGGRERRYVA